MLKNICIISFIIIILILLIFLIKIIDKEFYKSFNKIYFWEKSSNDLEILGRYGINREDRKIISVSLFGKKEYYFNNARKMLKNISREFPGWKLRIYIHYKVDPKIITEFIEKGAQIVIIKQDNVTPSDSTFWRFLPAEEDIIFICRDVDYNLNREDFLLVEDWIKNSKNKFMKYQARVKNWKILNLFYKDFLIKNFWAGFWGGKGRCIPDILDRINNFKYRKHWHSDELFLETIIWDNYVKKYGISIYFHNYYSKQLKRLRNKVTKDKIDIYLSNVNFNSYLKQMESGEKIKKFFEYFTN